MKIMRTKNFLKLLVCVLAVSLLVAFAINATNIAKPLTQKKVVNPDNLLNASDIVWSTYATKDGLIYERNEDGSWHIYGQSTGVTGMYLTLDRFSLTPGKTYMLSSGMKHDTPKSHFLDLCGSDGNWYLGNLEPDYESKPDKYVYGAFEAKKGVTYYVHFYVPHAGAVIDEVVYPCLVEGTEPADFYIYK